jgi:hypothetical protein
MVVEPEPSGEPGPIAIGQLEQCDEPLAQSRTEGAQPPSVSLLVAGQPGAANVDLKCAVQEIAASPALTGRRQ